MLADLAISLVLGLFFFSPIIFLALGHKKLALINGSFLVLYLIAWYFALMYKGAMEINLATTMWLLLLLINIIFLIVSYSKAVTKIFSLNNRTLFVTGCVVLFLSASSYLLVNNHEFSSNYYFNFIFFLVPAYFIGLIIVGLIAMFRRRSV